MAREMVVRTREVARVRAKVVSRVIGGRAWAIARAMVVRARAVARAKAMARAMGLGPGQ